MRRESSRTQRSKQANTPLSNSPTSHAHAHAKEHCMHSPYTHMHTHRTYARMHSCTITHICRAPPLPVSEEGDGYTITYAYRSIARVLTDVHSSGTQPQPPLFRSTRASARKQMHPLMIWCSGTQGKARIGRCTEDCIQESMQEKENDDVSAADKTFPHSPCTQRNEPLHRHGWYSGATPGPSLHTRHSGSIIRGGISG